MNVDLFRQQTADMWDIIERWGNKEKDPENYIFPVLSPGLSPIRQYEIKQNFTQFINKNMAKISVNEEIGKNIKTIETQHPVSTLMKNAGCLLIILKNHSDIQVLKPREII